MSHAGEWMAKSADEEYHHFFPTREAAIRDAPGELHLRPGDAFEIGQAHAYVLELVDEDSVHLMLQQFRADAFDAAGEASEDYLSDVDDEHKEELRRLLSQAFSSWSAKHGYEPRFYVVDNEETHTAAAPPPASSLEVLASLLDPAKVSNVTITSFCLACGRADCACPVAAREVPRG